MRIVSLILTALLLQVAHILAAQEVLRPVTSSYTLEGGSAHLHDTYLSPIGYDGMTYAFTYRRAQAMKFNPEQWVMQLNMSVGVDYTENPARNATMWGTGIKAQWNMVHRWKLPHNITVAAGPGTGVNLGVLYLNRNQNNPASAKASWSIDATGYVSWNTRLFNIPVTLRYQPVLPLTGVFFSPQYDELYYEIYLGNHKGLAHFGWWGNRPQVRSRLRADWQLGRYALTLGFDYRFQGLECNGITTRMAQCSGVVGIAF